MSDLPWEDALLERKTENDLKDLRKTMVAFANSVRPGHTAVILIGEREDGDAPGVKNPDAIQKKVREEADKVYPDIVWRSQVYEKIGNFCVRVEIEYSGKTPHFGGPAWVRRGSETVKASDEVFQQLIDLRTDLVRELAQWVGKEITIRWYAPPSIRGTWVESLLKERLSPRLLSVNRHWATFICDGRSHSEPLKRLTLSWDDQENRLQVLVQR